MDTAVWTEDPALIGLVQEIWDEHLAADEAGKQKGGKKPARPYIEQLRVLVTALYLVWREDPPSLFGYAFLGRSLEQQIPV
ncbi:hypothetical protein DVR11_14295 [Paracoccus versutus]|nr:hypothetical protein DVR11_14295 [Paracoccus versutus]